MSTLEYLAGYEKTCYKFSFRFVPIKKKYGHGISLPSINSNNLLRMLAGIFKKRKSKEDEKGQKQILAYLN